MARKKRVNQALYDASIKLRILGKKGGGKIWTVLSDMLLLPKRRRVCVNVLKINRETSPGETVAVAGKVLGNGSIDHPVTVSAYSFSSAARRKILDAGGRCISLEELAKENPKGSNIRVIR
jgi:large subunit ribosomal protein L18e